MTVIESGRISDDRIRAMLDDAVRGQLSEPKIELLHSPEIVDRAHDILVSMKQNVEGQLAAKQAEADAKRSELMRQGPDGRQEWLEYNVRYQKWRAGALRFKSGVDDFLSSINGTRKSNKGLVKEDILKEERNEYLFTTYLLKKAISEHRDHLCNDRCDELCEADRKLWSLIG